MCVKLYKRVPLITVCKILRKQKDSYTARKIPEVENGGQSEPAKTV